VVPFLSTLADCPDPEIGQSLRELFTENGEFKAVMSGKDLGRDTIYPPEPSTIGAIMVLYASEQIPPDLRYKTQFACFDYSTVDSFVDEYEYAIGFFHEVYDHFHALTPQWMKDQVDRAIEIPQDRGLRAIAGFSVAKAIESDLIYSCLHSSKRVIEEIGLQYRQILGDTKRVLEEQGIFDKVTEEADREFMNKALQGELITKDFGAMVIARLFPPVETIRPMFE